MNHDTPISKRKSEHIDIVLNTEVQGLSSNGLESYIFQHQALPEVDYSSIRIDTQFLQKRVQTPFVVSSMTGGTDEAHVINMRLAEIAQQRGWTMGLGSTRAALESPVHAHTFKVRKIAPTIPIFANLGAVQLNNGYGVNACKKIIDITEADALVLHLNSLQEVFQVEGDTNFSNLLPKIEQLCKELDVPVGVKEVGWGIDGALGKRLYDIGVHFVDVAGAGGTSWSQVEKQRTSNDILQQAAEAFTDWGIPTAVCLEEMRHLNNKEILIASGGIQTGVEAAKSIALGADLVGFGGAILRAAVASSDTLNDTFQRLESELRISMFGIGVKDIHALQQTDRLRKKE